MEGSTIALLVCGLVLLACAVILIGSRFPNTRFGALMAKVWAEGNSQRTSERVGRVLGVLFLALLGAGLSINAYRDITQHGWDAKALRWIAGLLAAAVGLFFFWRVIASLFIFASWCAIAWFAWTSWISPVLSTPFAALTLGELFLLLVAVVGVLVAAGVGVSLNDEVWKERRPAKDGSPS
ncbi:MAG: hypothetical protein HS128_10150 [Ideonella sp.]|nr:hypothetical protein [Ideonella sp.]